MVPDVCSGILRNNGMVELWNIGHEKWMYPDFILPNPAFQHSIIPVFL
jgi:hypothetical protein